MVTLIRWLSYYICASWNNNNGTIGKSKKSKIQLLSIIYIHGFQFSLKKIKCLPKTHWVIAGFLMKPSGSLILIFFQIPGTDEYFFLIKYLPHTGLD
jgi:hypothetical protein